MLGMRRGDDDKMRVLGMAKCNSWKEKKEKKTLKSNNVHYTS
jgi:hypothetical protein